MKVKLFLNLSHIFTTLEIIHQTKGINISYKIFLKKKKIAVELLFVFVLWHFKAMD